jgi:HlyD family secretion protein
MSKTFHRTNPSSHSNPPSATSDCQPNDVPERSAVRTSRRKLRHWAGWAWIVVAATVLLGWAGYREYIARSAAGIPDITVPVTGADPAITVTEQGELESSAATETHCEVEGDQNKIVTLLPEGSPVKKGDVVITFDTEQLKKTLVEQEVKTRLAEGKTILARGELEAVRNKALGDTAKADLALKLAEFDRDKYLEGEYRVEDAKKKGLISVEEEELQAAKEKLAGLRRLVKKGFAPPESLRLKELEIDNKALTLSNNKADLTVLEKFTRRKQEMELSGRVEDAKRELARVRASSKAAIEKAQADLEAAETAARLEKTALSRAQKQLERAVVKAAQDGIIFYAKDPWSNPENRIRPGALVRYHQRLFSLPDLTRLQVKVRIHEAAVKMIHPGLQAEVRVDSLGDLVFPGSITKVETLADFNGNWGERRATERVAVVKVNGIAAQAGLKPGMTAEVRIPGQELSDVSGKVGRQ